MPIKESNESSGADLTILHKTLPPIIARKDVKLYLGGLI